MDLEIFLSSLSTNQIAVRVVKLQPIIFRHFMYVTFNAYIITQKEIKLFCLQQSVLKRYPLKNDVNFHRFEA